MRRQLRWPKRFPTNSTYSEALARCDAQEIVTVIAGVLLKARAVKQCESEPSRLQANKQEEILTHVAMDGKMDAVERWDTRVRDNRQCIWYPSMSARAGSS